MPSEIAGTKAKRFFRAIPGLPKPAVSKNLWSNQYGFDLTFILFLLFSLFAAILHFYYEKLLAAFSLKWVSEKVSQAGFQVLSAAETLFALSQYTLPLELKNRRLS